jgi:oligopeptide/dipeptide ABC transporter ATP-binding protein
VSVLVIDDLSVDFMVERRALRAVDGLSLSIDAGEHVALVGESGSGKTVTALAVLGLVDPPGLVTSGSVTVVGREMVGRSESELRMMRGRDVGMVFQDSSTALNPSMRIGDQIAEAIEVHDSASTRATRRTRVEELLELVGLGRTRAVTRARDYPHQLSGGMRQRVMLAIALANRPRLLVADEPTTALDATTQAELMTMLDTLRRELDLAILFVTHDLALVAGHADRVVVMYAGRVVEEATAAELFVAPRHPYTRGLLASSPHLGTSRGELTVIPGQPPRIGAVPDGCAFHPRCAFAEPRCIEAIPALRPLGDAHSVACVRAEELPSAVVPS